jgi:hypothetical protein
MVNLMKLTSGVSPPRLLSTALANAGRDAEAEAVCRETMVALNQMGLNAPKRSMTQLRTKLGNALLNQDRVAEARVFFERCLSEFTELFGPDDVHTLDCARSLADTLSQQGKHTEAVSILRDTARRSSRASGPESVATLDSMYRLADALLEQGKHNGEALAMYVEHMPVMKRVLGPDHVIVLLASVSYARALLCCGRFVEAEAMLAETLAVMTRVLGAEHPYTRFTVERMTMVRGFMNAPD